MWQILDYLKKGNSPQKLTIFTRKKKIYLLIRFKRETQLAVSVDGLNFKKTEISKKILKYFSKNEKRKIIDKYIYESSLAPGSEHLNIHDLTIEKDIKTKDGILLFYHHHKDGKIEVGTLITDVTDPGKVRWRHNQPVWESPNDWKNKNPTFIDLVKTSRRYIAYWWLKKTGLFAITYPKYKIEKQIEIKQKHYLHKIPNNPIIAPKAKNGWEAFTTFNPAAIYESDKVHILYRAQGFDYKSILGYANSTNGTHITERQSYPAYIPGEAFEKKHSHPKGGKKRKRTLQKYMSGGGCEGCEDPRITRIGNKIYMTYVAFNGYNPPRIALTSIKLENFLAKRWLWKKPILISPPEIVDKSACILPEKINNKYVIFHRIFPNILIDFVDNLEFKKDEYLKGEYKITPRSPMWWDSRKIGVGAPPLKTKEGWLMIYQAVDDKNSGHYKVGAMLLDLKNPTKVLHRSLHPIIEPSQWYENDGFKAGVVYPCGAVIIEKQLFVYYGGADSYVCVATASLDQFLQQLKEQKDSKLESTYIGQVA
ncbi:hypothetical protein KKA02_01070 [Patescibacteria group bacterium]|nr:hypothetical protein [Patescibacteria group bacterium]